VAARKVSGALRQRILVNDASVLAKYQAKGCEIIRFSAADVAAARPKAMEAWRAATKGEALAGKILGSVAIACERRKQVATARRDQKARL
jgi:hypothetical protein